MPVVELAGVTKAYESKIAVDNLSLSIDAGPDVRPPGSKRRRQNQLHPHDRRHDHPRLRLHPPLQSALRPQILERVAYLPEERGLYKKMKVLDQLVFFGELHGISPAAESKKRAIDWAKRMEIDESLLKKTEELSKGMQQKIQFISCLLHDPGLIIMDEPFSGLDPVNAVLLENTLIELKNQGKAIVFSTHRMDQVEKLCDAICLIDKGRAVLAGKVREIKSSYPRDRIVVEFEGSSDFLKSPEIAEANNFSGHAEITLKARRQRAKASPRSRRRSHHLPLRNGRAVARRNLHQDRRRQGRCVISFSSPNANIREQIRGRAFRFSTILLPAALRLHLRRRLPLSLSVLAPASTSPSPPTIPLSPTTSRPACCERKTRRPSSTSTPLPPPLTAPTSTSSCKSKSIDGLLDVESSSSGIPTVTYTSPSAGDFVTGGRLEASVDDALVKEKLTGRRRPIRGSPMPSQRRQSRVLPDEKGRLQGQEQRHRLLLQGLCDGHPALHDHHHLRTQRRPLHHSGENLAHLRGHALDRQTGDLLAGKLIGVGAVGLTQILIWVFAGAIIIATPMAAAQMTGNFEVHFSWVEAVLFPVYFILGYFLYSSLFAGLAATCETEQELQMFTPLAAVPVWLSFA
jgi:ABC-2 type transport system ATP-binding protein